MIQKNISKYEEVIIEAAKMRNWRPIDVSQPKKQDLASGAALWMFL